MTSIAVEMQIEPCAETLLTSMGRQMKLRARSTIYNRLINHIRNNFHVSDVAAWFSEDRFAARRRTTVRLSPENAQYLNAIAQVIGKGRPAVLLELVYFAGVNLSRDDLQSLGR